MKNVSRSHSQGLKSLAKIDRPLGGKYRGVWVVFALFGALCSGCGQSQTHKVDSKPAIEKTAERGPIRLKVTLDKDRVAVAEPIGLLVEASAPDSFQVRLPSLEDPTGVIQVRSAKEMPGVSSNGTHQWRELYQLESLTSGDQNLPAITIHYRGFKGDRGSQAGPAVSQSSASTQPASLPAPEIIEGDLTIDPLTIHVTSALTGESDPSQLAHIRDIKGAVDIPYARNRRWMFWAGWALAVLALANGIFLYYRWWRRRVGQIPQIEPGTWATQEFRRLEGDRLVEQRLFHDFYFRLSGIVREYIERRFRLMAPERTTDEFLREVRDNPALREEHQGLLRGFLESADQVKFALYEPSSEEAEKAFAAARDFVNETAYVLETGEGEPSIQTEEEVAGTVK